MSKDRVKLGDMCRPNACHHKRHLFSQQLAKFLSLVERKAMKNK